jgi:DNA-binding winged helix-turn-helix (wHTH) protein/tetratricopeptide (TPR) repeat protein
MTESTSFEFGPFRLDAAKSVLWRGKELVALTPKAVALLRVLVEHGGDVVSKQELMTRVWPDAAVEEGNLSVTVAALRKVLDPQPDGRSHIQTVARRGYRFDAPVRGGGEPRRLALAVLPFTTLGPETPAHLGMAMADSVIGRLTAYETLVVRPTLAVAHYTSTPKPPREAAAELGVDAVLTGTVQREGDRVRVSVQLVPRPAALAPWAASFDAGWIDLFQVLDDLTHSVVQAIWPRLSSGAAEEVPPARYAPGPEAHEAYLRGRFFWSRFDPENLGKAFASYGEAAALDPRYGAALSGLADAHLLLGLAGLSPPQQSWDTVVSYAARALECDRTLAEAHVARAYALLFRDWDWPGAAQEIDRAVALAPGAASVHLWRGLFLALRGDLPGARSAIARAREIDRLSIMAAAFQCLVHEMAGENEDALAVARRATDLHPRNFLGQRCLGVASVRLGKKNDGLKALKRGVELSGQGPGMLALLACAEVTFGNQGEARRLLLQLERAAATSFTSPCLRAAVLLALGDREAALARIEEGAEARDAFAVFLAVDPLYASLAEEPRFRAVLARVARKR